MLPSTAYLLSDAFRQSLQFSTVTPAAPHSPVQHATIDHNTLSHAELANAVKNGGPHQFHESELPKIGMRLRKSGQFSAADIVDSHAKAIQAAKQPPAAPVATRPNLPAYAGVLSPNRKKAVMDFVNHANPDVQKHVADHQVHVPGLTPKDAYARAQKAYDTFHAAHMGVPMATAEAEPSIAPSKDAGIKRVSSWTKDERYALARKMGLNFGTPEHDKVPIPKMEKPETPVITPSPVAAKPNSVTIDPSKYIPDRKDRLRLRTMEAWAFKTPEGKKAYDESGIGKLGMGPQHTEAFHQLYDQYHSGQQSAAPSPQQPAKQTPADVAKMHAEAVRSGRPVPPQYLDRVQKNLRAHGYHAEADQIAPKQDDAAYAADQFGSGTIPATTGITGAGMKRPGAPAPQRSFLNDESTGSPAKLPPRRPAPASTPAEQLPAPKFGYSTHTAPAGVVPGEQSEQQPSTHGRFSRLLDAARQGKLKEHVEGGLGNFFDKFERHGGKLLKKIGIDTGYNEQEYSRVSVAIANLNDIVQEFARKSDPNQMSLFGGDEIALATAPTSKARKLRKPAPGQKSFNWDEEAHPRENSHHDGKRPGEFAPKESGHTSDTKQEPESEKPAEKPEGNPDKRTYSAKGNEIYDEHGVRHGAFRNEEKAKDAAERWNREGKPNSTPAAKAVEAKFPSLAGYVEPESKPEPAPKSESASATESIKNPDSEHESTQRHEGAPGSDDSGSVGDAEQKSTLNRLTDFGEKIGGARKDLAVSGGYLGREKTTKKTDGPAWAARYDVSQIAKSTDKSEEGKWSLTDKRNTDWFGQPKQLGVFGSKEAAEAAIPLAEVSRNHSTMNLAKKDEPDNWAIYRQVGDRKRPVIKDGFATRGEADAYMALHPVEIIETKTRIDDSIHPSLEKIVREGDKHRSGNIGEKEFRKFGFRGVEFGNWNNSPERQHIVNHAYDSLTDMAKILGIPDKAVSLDGDLGIGFGSRGRGLSSAKAHYERQYAAINLTKLKGAGSLAHEWWHAFDHWVGRISGKASDEWLDRNGDRVLNSTTPEKDYPSHGFHWRKKDGFRKEVQDAFNAVMDAITNKSVEYTEDKSLYERVHEKNASKISESLDEFRNHLARDYSKDTGYQEYKGKRALPASDEVLKEVDSLIDKIKRGDVGETVAHGSGRPSSSRFGSAGTYMPANIARLADIHKQLRGNSGYSKVSGYVRGRIADIISDSSAHKHSTQKLKDAAEQKVKSKTAKTDFVANATKMDLGTKGNYWSEPHELAARAFESYVYDKIKEAGHRDDFLAYEKHNNHLSYILKRVKPYAEGDERVKMNAAFDNLFRVMRDHELAGKVERKKPEARVIPRDDGTWEGHWGSKGATPSQILKLKNSIGEHEGVVHVNKKGTQASFYSASRNRVSVDDLLKSAQLTKKPGKLFAIRKGEAKEFSRASSLDTALSRLTALSSSLRNAS